MMMEFASKMIMDDIIMFGKILDNILSWFEYALRVVRKYTGAINLKKRRLLCLVQYFVSNNIIEDEIFQAK